MKRARAYYIAFDLESWDEWVTVRAESVERWLEVWPNDEGLPGGRPSVDADTA